MPTNRELSIIMRLRDLATRQFQKAAAAWEQGLAGIRRGAQAADRGLTGFLRIAAKTGRVLTQVGDVAQSAERALTNIGQAANTAHFSLLALGEAAATIMLSLGSVSRISVLTSLGLGGLGKAATVGGIGFSRIGLLAIMAAVNFKGLQYIVSTLSIRLFGVRKTAQWVSRSFKSMARAAGRAILYMTGLRKATTRQGRELVRLGRAGLKAIFFLKGFRLVLGGMRTVIKMLTTGFIMLKIAIATVFVMGIKSAIKYGLEIGKMAKATGMTAKEISKLTYAAKQESAGIESLNRALPVLAQNMRQAKMGVATYTDAFSDMNVAWEDSQGHLRPLKAVFLDIADYVKKARNQTEALSTAQAVLGQGTADLLPLLLVGREGIERLGREAGRLGIVLDARTVRAMKAFEAQLKIAKAGLKGVWVGIAEGLLPQLNKVADWMNNLPAMTRQAKALGQVIGQWGENIWKEVDKASKTSAGFWDHFLAPIRIIKAFLGVPMKFDIEMPKWKEKLLKKLHAVDAEIKAWQKLKKGTPLLSDSAFVGFKRKKLLNDFMRLWAHNRVAGVKYANQRIKELLQAHAKDVEKYKKKIRKLLGLSPIFERSKPAQKYFDSIKKELKDLTEKAKMARLGISAAAMPGYMKAKAALDKIFALKEKYYSKDKELVTMLTAVKKLKLDELVAKYKKAMPLIRQAVQQAAKGMQQAMSTFFFDVITRQLKTAGDYLRAFGKMMAQILANLLAQKAMLSLFSPSTGIFKSIGKFLGVSALAKGGRIEQGQVQPLPYYAAAGAMVARGRAVPIVAHEGEWIGTPARLAAAGIGRGQGGEQRPIIQHFNIYAQDVKSFVDRIDEVKDHIFKITKEAIGDNNPIRRSF